MSTLLNSKVRSSSVGLDIGSNSVRAAELSRSRRGTTLERYAQIGLPSGSVVDGEIVDHGAVVVALRRLWSEGGFSSRTPVLTVSGQRVIVRQADVPAMSESDFRSALRFQAMDLIPIPVDDALLDFVKLQPGGSPGKQADQMQILLAAAHRSAVDAHLSVLREANLRALAVDPAPMAAVRALDLCSLPDDSTVALVDVGADITLIAVRSGGRVRYSRILNSGGSDLTTRLADRLQVDQAEAESMKRTGRAADGATLLVDDVDPLVAEIESSLSFFAAQLGAQAPDRVLVTGGGSRSPEVIAELARRLPMPVDLLDAFTGLDHPDLELDPGAVLAATTSGLLPIGAAQWAFDSPARRLSLLPGDVAAAAAVRRRVVAIGAGVAVLAAALAGLTIVRGHQLSQARAQTAATQSVDLRSQERINALAPIASLNAAIQTRLAVVAADDNDNVAWTTLLHEITAAMPQGTRLSGLQFADATGQPSAGSSSGGSDSAGASSSASGSSTPVMSGALGSVTMTVTGPASEEQVAVWLRALRHVPGLSSVWVPSASVSKGKVTFTSSGGVTSAAPLVQRPAIEGGSK